MNILADAYQFLRNIVSFDTFYLIAIIAGWTVGTVIFLVAFWWFLRVIFALPTLPQTILVYRRLRQIKANGFHSTEQYIGAGGGIAIDADARKIFLASGLTTKLYGFDKIAKVETKMESDDSTIWVTVKDLDSPFFEIKATATNKLRKIYNVMEMLGAIPGATTSATLAPDQDVDTFS